ALAEVLRGDMGTLLAHLGDLLLKMKDDALAGSLPKDRKAAKRSWQELTHAYEQLADHGVYVACEVRKLENDAHFQATLVFPDDSLGVSMTEIFTTKVKWKDGLVSQPGPVQQYWERDLLDKETHRKKITRNDRTITYADVKSLGSAAWWIQDGH